MDSEEHEVYFYLKDQIDQFVSANSICRHAGGRRRFCESPEWAKAVLRRMQERGIVEADATGAYRLKPMPRAGSAAKRWVSPQIEAILKQSGQKFNYVIKNGDDADAYYNSL